MQKTYTHIKMLFRDHKWHDHNDATRLYGIKKQSFFKYLYRLKKEVVIIQKNRYSKSTLYRMPEKIELLDLKEERYIKDLGVYCRQEINICTGQGCYHQEYCMAVKRYFNIAGH